MVINRSANADRYFLALHSELVRITQIFPGSEGPGLMGQHEYVHRVKVELFNSLAMTQRISRVQLLFRVRGMKRSFK